MSDKLHYQQLECGDLTNEAYREYEWHWNGVKHVYRINDPVEVYFRKGGSTHRVLDEAGVVHIVPCIGSLGCAVRVRPRNLADPVQW